MQSAYASQKTPRNVEQNTETKDTIYNNYLAQKNHNYKACDNTNPEKFGRMTYSYAQTHR